MDDGVLVLRFEENRERPGSVMAWLPDGVPVFPDRRNRVQLRAGEAWECRVERRGRVAFAQALRAVAQEPKLPEGPEAWASALEGPAGTRFKDALLASLRKEADARLRDATTELAERVAALEQHVAAFQREASKLQEAWTALQARERAQPRGPETQGEPSHANPALGRKAPWVAKGEFENSMRALRERLEALARSGSGAGADPLLAAKLEAMERRLRDLEGRASGTDSVVQQMRRDLEQAMRKRAPKPAAPALPSEVLEGLAERVSRAAEPPEAWECAVLAAMLAQGQAMERAAGFVQRVRSRSLPLGPPAPLVGAGSLGACASSGCSNAPVGFVPAIDVTDPEEPVVLPALACPEHEAKPPLLVVLRRTLNRRTAPAAFEAFAAVAGALGLPRPASLASQHVQVHGPAAARRAWDLEAKNWAAP